MRDNMGFLDEAAITARSGDGGRGCISFRRERFIPKGGPDGGDGGDGGDIVIRANKKLHSLFDYRSHKYFKAKNGESGRGKNQSGKNGPSLFLDMPLGTIIRDAETGDILADLTRDDQEAILIHGGKGGKGNKHFASSTNRAPRYAQPGNPGEEKTLRLSLKFIADIGIIGLPNTGKSTLLTRLTMAHPKVGNYPFTTIIPNLGVMTFEEQRPLIIADIPGVIEGASQGRGLGHRFLKHIERTGLLLHLLDITFQSKQDIIEDFHTLNREMKIFKSSLAEKPQFVLINKMDLYGPEHRDLEKVQAALKNVGMESFPISALTGNGLEELRDIILEKVDFSIPTYGKSN